MLPPEIRSRVPWDKSLIIRYCFLDLLYGDVARSIAWLEAHYLELGDDLVALHRTLLQYIAGEDIDVGESGTLYRFWKSVLDALDDTRIIIMRGTLLQRPLHDSPTSQWDSAAVLLGHNNPWPYPMPYHLQLTYEAVARWKDTGGLWAPERDRVITRQLEAYIEYRRTGVLNFEPRLAEDFCFVTAYNPQLIRPLSKQFDTLAGHESNRPIAMRHYTRPWRRICDTWDHRVYYSLRMFRPWLTFTHPECVNKSWPGCDEVLRACS